MNRTFFPIYRRVSRYLPVVPFLLLAPVWHPVSAWSDPADDSLIQLVTPFEGIEVIGKRPLIKCRISEPFKPEDLLVLLDATDITGVLSLTPEGFEYKPIQTLPPGTHTLNVTVRTMRAGGARAFTFSSRHSRPFEEFYSENEILAQYEDLIHEHDDGDRLPSYEIESNLGSHSELKESGWAFAFDTNLRYLDQERGTGLPVEDGLQLANFLGHGTYDDHGIGLQLDVGDIQIDESETTVQGLARRGGSLILRSKELSTELRGFSVKSEQVFGFEGGMGLGGSTDDHILGVSGGIGLLSERMKFKTVYVTGGEEDDFFGLSTTDGRRKGDTLGLILSTDFFQQKLITGAEFDFSEFDTDTSDEDSAERDKAYQFKAGGYWRNYAYEASYGYVGPEYQTIGNQFLVNDTEYLTLRTGASFQIHTIGLFLSRSKNNVEENNLDPVTFTSEAMIDYTFNKWPSLPMALGYRKSILETEKEPPLTPPVRAHTDAVSGTISYLKGPWVFGLYANYSLQDDRSDEDNDTSTFTSTFSPAYRSEHFYVSPVISFNQLRYHPTRTRTDTYTGTVDLGGDILRERLFYHLAGTYNWLEANDGSIKQDTLDTNFNLACRVAKDFWGFLNPWVEIRGQYNRTKDRVYRTETDEFALFLVFKADASRVF